MRLPFGGLRGVLVGVTARAGAETRGEGRKSAKDLSTLRELWRFRGYARKERVPLLVGVLMRGLELAADLAAPWPLALVINDLLEGGHNSGPLQWVAHWFGGGALAMLVVAAVSVLLITAVSGVFDYLGDVFMNGAGERITS